MFFLGAAAETAETPPVELSPSGAERVLHQQLDPQQPWRADPDADGPEPEAAEPLPNFARVSTGVFRSGQPLRAGLAVAKARGIRTLLNLRLRFHKDEKEAAEALGLGLAHVPMNGVYSPTFRQVDRALEVLTDPDRRPVLVHCHYGEDRTGTVIAAYRAVVDGWPVERAVEEARSFGCCHPYFIELDEWLRYYLAHRAGLPAAFPAPLTLIPSP